VDSEARKEFERRFVDYKNWLHEWRELARVTFERRDYLIQLGLAQRRTRGAAGDAPDAPDGEEIVEDGSD
jgi:hypothetical protein